MPSRKKCSKTKIYRPKYISPSGQKVKGKCLIRSAKRHCSPPKSWKKAHKSASGKKVIGKCSSKRKSPAKRKSPKKPAKMNFEMLDIAWAKFKLSKTFVQIAGLKDAYVALIKQDEAKTKEYYKLFFSKISSEIPSLIHMEADAKIYLLKIITAINNLLNAAPASVPAPSIQ